MICNFLEDLIDTAKELRDLFMIILLNCNLSDPQNIWERFKII